MAMPPQNESLARSRHSGLTGQFRLEWVPMEERDFFDESQSRKPANLSCMYCHQSDTYEILWLVRTKKRNLRGGADETDRAKFAKARSYMVRRDDFMVCKNQRCRKRFEILGVQSVVFGEPVADPENDNRGNR